jgi:hypothetical protein
LVQYGIFRPFPGFPKVTSVEAFRPGQTILVDSGSNLETAVISTVGTAGATTLRLSTDTGGTILPTTNVAGLSKGQPISIGDGANAETAVVALTRARGGPTITLARAHASSQHI